MPRNCIIQKCKNHTWKTQEPTRYHMIPTNEANRARWKKWIADLNGSEPSNSATICTEHFEMKYYLRNGRLTFDAVPTKPFGAGLAPVSTPNASLPVVHIDAPQPALVVDPARLPLKERIHNSTVASKVSGQAIVDKSSNPLPSPSEPCKKRSKFLFGDTDCELSNDCVCSDCTSCVDEPCEMDMPIDPLSVDPLCVEVPLRKVELPQTSGPPLTPTRQTNTEMICVPTTPQRSPVKGRKRFIGDFKPSDFSSPRRATRNLKYIKDTYDEQRKALHNEKKKVRLLRRKVKTMEVLITQFS